MKYFALFILFFSSLLFANEPELTSSDQITQLVNLKTKTLYGSGIIAKKDRIIEHFQMAKIEKIVKGKPSKQVWCSLYGIAKLILNT